MARDLESLAKDHGTKWTDTELVFWTYEVVRELSPSAAAAHLQASLSPAAVASIRLAVERVLQKMGPDIESFGVGYITVEAPVHFDDADYVPMDFVRDLASHLTPSA